MAIILSAKKLQSILQRENEPLVVVAQKNSGEIQVVGMTEYLEKEQSKKRIGFGVG
jgi:hypothetical protein